MPSSEAAYGGSSGGHYRLRLDVTLLSQEVGNNRSRVRLVAYMRKTGTSQVWNLDPTPGNTVANGSQANHNINGYDGRNSSGPWYLVNPRDVWVGHNSNGQKTASFSAYHNASNSPYLTTASTSLNYTLPAIPKPPSVSTSNPTNIGLDRVTMNGNVSFTGNVSLSQRGFAWGTSPNPTGNKINVGGQTGNFSRLLTGLQPNTTYHYRAYAVNSQGTVYGANKSFTTLRLPSILTDPVTNVTGTTATAHGELTDAGNPTITEKGFEYRTTPEPSQPHTKVVVAGSSLGAFTANLVGLNPSTTYYIRAYAQSSAGKVTGEYVSFQTVVPAVVVTNEAVDVTTTSATGRGDIQGDGGGTITQHGFVWSTSPNPTLADSKLELGPGTLGQFSGEITGLSPSNIYYYRAFATNEGGTAYGAQRTINTAQTPPAQPTLLSPIGGIAVPTLTPTLDWTYNPGSANDTQYAYQLQLVRQSDSSVVYDTGKVVSSDTEIVLPEFFDESPTESPGDDEMIWNETYQWRVKTWNQVDQEGPYSTYGLFKTSQRPELTVTFPTNNSTIVTNTPVIQWTFTDPEGTSQTAYRVIILNSSNVVLFDTGKTVGADNSQEIPQNILENGGSYTLRVQVWDGDDLASLVTQHLFTLEYLAPAQPTITAQQDAAGIVQLNVAIPSPPRDGWNADILTLYRKEEGEINFRVIREDIPVTQRIIDDMESADGWTTDDLAKTPSLGEGKYGDSSLALATEDVNALTEPAAYLGGMILGTSPLGSGQQIPIPEIAGNAIFTKAIDIDDLNRYDTFSGWIFCTAHNNFSSIDFKFGTDSDNYYLVSIPASQLVDNSWNPIHVAAGDWTVVGQPSDIQVDFIGIEVKNVETTISSGDIRVDQLRFVDSSYTFQDYRTANGQILTYGATAYSNDGDVSSVLSESNTLTIAFTEPYINMYVLPIDDVANMSRAYMDGTRVPNWQHRTETRYYEPIGSSKPIVVYNSQQNYIEGSMELRFFDEAFGGMGLIGLEHLQSIKNRKPLILRTWWGRNYIISIDGDINVQRRPGIGWYANFNFTEINE